MSVSTYRCPSCGNGLAFDPDLQKLVCDYCGNQYHEHEILNMLREKEEAVAHTAVFSCPSCGAEVATDETTAATYCYYCHNPVVLSGRLQAEFRPDFVLPFKVGKEKARETFLKWVKGKRYVPAGFYDESNIDKITGVYYPYWLANYTMDAQFEGEGKISQMTSTANENITTTQHFRVVRGGEVTLRNLQRSALRKADRKLADGVHPYHFEEMQPFTETVLSGFQAEKRDINSEEYHQSVEQEVGKYVQPLLTGGHGYHQLNGSTASRVKTAKYSYVLLPTWVVTYTGANGQIYYYSMNGQTQETCGVLPVDRNKLLRDCFVLAAGIFALACAGGYFLW